jgi:hypothetical protein
MKIGSHMVELRLLSNHKRFIILYLLGIAALVCIFYSVDFLKNLGGDYAFYFSNGWFLHNGLKIYVDFWTHKTPFLAMVLAVWIGIFGSSFYSAVSFLFIITILCSYSVFALSSEMMLSRGICFLSGFLFALFTSMHGVDPGRDGVIILLASMFELLSLVMLIRGLRRGSDRYLFFSGFLLVVAVASRQTSLPIYFFLFVVIIIFKGLKSKGRTFQHFLVMSIGCIGASTLFLTYLFSQGVSIRILWEQLINFNILYASWFRMDLLSWIYSWILIGVRSLLFFSATGLAFLVIRLRYLIKYRSLISSDWILLSLFVAHLISLWLSAKSISYYALLLFPELSIMASIVVVKGISSGIHSDGISNINKLRWTRLIMASIILMILIPLAYEGKSSYNQLKDAIADGYLTNIRSLPGFKDDLVVAQKIQEIVKNKTDRIWLFQYGHDMVYVLSNRMPAISFTQCAPLNSEAGYPDQIKQNYDNWVGQFLKNKPKIVIISAEVESAMLLPKMETVISTSMYKVSAHGVFPEIYVRMNEPK